MRQVHSETKQMEYSGAVLELAECLSRLPAGGQTLISGTTFQRIAGRLQASTIHIISAFWTGSLAKRQDVGLCSWLKSVAAFEAMTTPFWEAKGPKGTDVAQ